MQNTKDLIRAVRANGEDNEFYPTSRPIILAVAADLSSISCYRKISILDIGAGNGKVLESLAEIESLNIDTLYAIEKSEILLSSLDAKIFVIGTDFHEQSLLSQKIDITFCNPPYSEFEDWAEKIIRESASKRIYLVIPKRWKDSIRIADALKYRNSKAQTIGSFSFEAAEDRQARADVDVLRIELPEEEEDAFSRFFDEQFADLKKKFEPGQNKEEFSQKENFSQLVVGPSYPEALVSLYQEEMAKIQRNYQMVGELDSQMLAEFDIDTKKIKSCLKTRLDGLKLTYWRELFSHLDTITNRLASKKRNLLLTTLNNNVHVDFTLGNIYAIVLWVIKNANVHIDTQLVEVYEKMVDKANVHLYKSNQKTWVEDRWRYNSGVEENSHYSLDYRIVTHRVGGFDSQYSWSTGLSNSAGEFLQDLLTIARNLGFMCKTNPDLLSHSGLRDWKAGTRVEFSFQAEEKESTLLDVRAFQNGNMHLRLHKDFIRKLNVEFGRLKGWLKSPQEAAEELKDPKAAEVFSCNHKLQLNSSNLLLCA